MTKSIDSPTGLLLAGLAVTLAAVGVFSFYALRQIRGLEDLQTRTVDRNRKDSLQLLRIQNDLGHLHARHAVWRRALPRRLDPRPGPCG
jgi:hypothetical protein